MSSCWTQILAKYMPQTRQDVVQTHSGCFMKLLHCCPNTHTLWPPSDRHKTLIAHVVADHCTSFPDQCYLSLQTVVTCWLDLQYLTANHGQSKISINVQQMKVVVSSRRQHNVSVWTYRYSTCSK